VGPLPTAARRRPCRPRPARAGAATRHGRHRCPRSPWPSLELGRAHQLLAEASLALGALDAASRAQHAALAVLEQLGHDDHSIDVLMARVAIGDLARLRGRNNEAEGTLTTALETTRAVDPMARAAALNALGVVFKDTARYHAASAAYREALAVVISRRGVDHPDTASLWHNLAGLAHARGHTGDALVAAERAVRIRLRAHGDGHRLVALDRTVRGAVLLDDDRVDDAERDFRHALGVFRRRHPADHYEVAVNLGNLATCHLRGGDPAQASDLHRQAFEIKSSILGREHPEVARQLHDLATRAAGESEGADHLQREAHRVATRTLPPGHPLIHTSEQALERPTAEPVPKHRGEAPESHSPS
jgi:tetratricopeptide (TPR) repeat protein